MIKELLMGIDIGSTTAKAVILDESQQRLFDEYRRHNGNIIETLSEICNKAADKLGDIQMSLALTGSAGMGLAERLKLPFVQELIATAGFIENRNKKAKTLIDIGGEDSKIIFFNGSGHDIRMNGSCAGGTGAFIDQMATLLDISLEKLNALAAKATDLYPIASRCGVFAKTDVQNLISREIPKPDIAFSIFYSLALQVKNSLMRGCEAVPKIIFSGGPLTFLGNLRSSMIKVLGIEEDDVMDLDRPELLPSEGAAIASDTERYHTRLSELTQMFRRSAGKIRDNKNKLQPLFESKQFFNNWKKKKNSVKAPRTSMAGTDGNMFLGIDSGSTTTKIVLINQQGRLAFDFYTQNSGDSIGAVKKGLELLSLKASEEGAEPKIAGTAVTGYGEDLIRAAFDIDYGIVETIAHFRSARVFDPDVSFILDIGGQDMKAIFVNKGIIRNIEINEACSSGCGSFIETFADSLGYNVADFSEKACDSCAPCDLGTRCTVFMNSKVKQSFREGSPVEDISAGLAYSVIRNCLHKVLRIFDPELLGTNIIVQGGTFRNPAVLRALEHELGREVISPDIAELMGAYGAALTASDKARACRTESYKSIDEINIPADYTVRRIRCKGCENKCNISRLEFTSGNYFYTGNRCEKMFSNRGRKRNRGVSLTDFKLDLLFNRKLKPNSQPIAVFGMPRALNTFENFPFWAKLLTECGIEVRLSHESSNYLSDLGAGTVMSDNICYPAKISHGHIMDLIESGVKEIFYPIVTFEHYEVPGANNSFNCPVVSGYPDVIKSALEPEKRGVKLHMPKINFRDNKLTRKAVYNFLKDFGISKSVIFRAYESALEEQDKYKRAIRQEAKKIIEKATAENRKIIVLAGRPYHIDHLINHKIPEMICDFGMDVVTEDSLPYKVEDIEDTHILSQWAYPNRLLMAAKWTGAHPGAELVQLNSFGCGPDTIVIDEVREILQQYGKNHTLIRIDEHSASGSLRLRIRSLIESIKLKENRQLDEQSYTDRITTIAFEKKDQYRTILVPYFSPFHSSYVVASFGSMGYKVEVLPESDQKSIDFGLKYVNNEICYPATLVIGDVLKALDTGKYDPDRVAIGISQTGGQCRASNYLSLLKKALVRAGYENIPVVGATLLKQPLNYQPGFKLDPVKLTVQGALGIIFGDAISMMYYATAPREKNRGDAWAIAQKYARIADKGIINSDRSYLLQKLREAVAEFNRIEVKTHKAPKIGLVGEIFVKYNPIGNHGIVNRLIDEGIEVVMPPLINMFIQWFVNIEVKQKSLSEERRKMLAASFFLERYYNFVYAKFEKVIKDFRYYSRQHGIREVADHAEEVMDLINLYFGEGWLIAGDISSFAYDGVKDVLCLQPFGCIANHIVARGVEKSLKKVHPDLNLLYLDIDSGVSEANIDNRLHLLLKHAREAAGE